jgi:hypothetical protein
MLYYISTLIYDNSPTKHGFGHWFYRSDVSLVGYPHSYCVGPTWCAIFCVFVLIQICRNYMVAKGLDTGVSIFRILK